MQDCDTQCDDFDIASIISAGTVNLLTEYNDSGQNEYAATRIFKFFSQSNMPDSFANFVNFVLFDKTNYKKWGAVEKNLKTEKKKKNKEKKIVTTCSL